MATAESMIDLTLDSDNDTPGNSPTISRRRSPSGGRGTSEPSAFKVRRQVQDIFPDICPTYLRGLVALESRAGTSGHRLFDNIIITIVDANGMYPKATTDRVKLGNAAMARKRKRPGSDAASPILADAIDGTDGLEFFDFDMGGSPGPELNLRSPASKRMKTVSSNRKGAGSAIDPFTLDDSDDSYVSAAEAPQILIECGCCFTEYHLAETTTCDALPAHSFCHSCARKYVESLIGQARCRPTCMDMSGCTAPFSRQQLQRFLDRQTFSKLESLQQDEEIRAAALEGLHDCPFCNFKAIPPPIEDDREFRCLNDGCKKVTCRLCNKLTHVPLSCEDAIQNQKENAQHALEEARSEAMLRSCNKCGTRFVKETGCNKMVCPKPGCRNLQCYVCRKDIANYDHFGAGKCPLFENTEARHEDEIKKAEDEVKARLKAANPELTDRELELKFSQKVKEDDRRRFNAAEAENRGRGPQFPAGLAVHDFHGYYGPVVHPQMELAMANLARVQRNIHAQRAAYIAPPPVPPELRGPAHAQQAAQPPPPVARQVARPPGLERAPAPLLHGRLARVQEEIQQLNAQVQERRGPVRRGRNNQLHDNDQVEPDPAMERYRQDVRLDPALARPRWDVPHVPALPQGAAEAIVFRPDVQPEYARLQWGPARQHRALHEQARLQVMQQRAQAEALQRVQQLRERADLHLQGLRQEAARNAPAAVVHPPGVHGGQQQPAAMQQRAALAMVDAQVNQERARALLADVRRDRPADGLARQGLEQLGLRIQANLEVNVDPDAPGHLHRLYVGLPPAQPPGDPARVGIYEPRPDFPRPPFQPADLHWRNWGF